MNSKKKKCIACIMAHADDIEITCGGTLAKYISQGYKGIYGVLSLCNSGWHHGAYSPSLETVPLRTEEAVKAAEVFNAELFKMELLENIFTDRAGEIHPLSFLHNDYDMDDVPRGGTSLIDAADAISVGGRAEMLKVAEILIKNAPDLIIGQRIDSNNPDHFNAALIVKKAYIEASKQVKLGPYYIPLSPNSFIPATSDWIVDVSGFEEIAEKAISCHESQNGFKHIKRMRQRWKEWGETISTESAECFIRIL